MHDATFAACCQPRDTSTHNAFALVTCNSFGANQSLCIANDPNCVFLPGANCTSSNVTARIDSLFPSLVDGPWTSERGGGRGRGQGQSQGEGRSGKSKKRERRRRRRRRRRRQKKRKKSRPPSAGRKLAREREGKRIRGRSPTRRSQSRSRRRRRRRRERSGRLRQGEQDEGGGEGNGDGGGEDNDNDDDNQQDTAAVGARTDLPPYPGYIPSFTSAPFPVLPAGACVARPPENAIYVNVTAASLCATVKRRALCEGSLYSLCRWVPAIGATTQRFCYPYSPGTERAKAADCPSRKSYSTCVAASPCKWFVVKGVPSPAAAAASASGPAPSPKVVTVPGGGSATLPGPISGGPAPAPTVVTGVGGGSATLSGQAGGGVPAPAPRVV